MGLLAKYFDGETSARTAGDDALLLHGMMCIAGADGSFDQAEIALLEGYFAQLPEFRGKDFDKLIAEARDIVTTYASTLESIEALAELSSPGLKGKMFVLAADIAFANGHPNKHEELMLEVMQRVLEIDAATAAKVFDVLAMKHMRL